MKMTSQEDFDKIMNMLHHLDSQVKINETLLRRIDRKQKGIRFMLYPLFLCAVFFFLIHIEHSSIMDAQKDLLEATAILAENTRPVITI